MIHRYMRDNGHGHNRHVNFMIKCVCYMGLGSNGCFMTSTTLMPSHYRTNIISGVSNLRSDSVVLLVLYMVAYNDQGIDIILQVHRDSTNFAEKV
jgi:hypothetical protein